MRESFHNKPRLGRRIDFDHPLTRGLVGCWLMNESSGDIVNDLSGNKWNGNINGNVSWISGKHGNGLNMPAGANDDYINIEDRDLGEIFTLVASVNISGADVRRAIMSSTGATVSTRFTWEINASNQHACFFYGIGTTWLIGSSGLTGNNFLSISYDGSDIHIWEQGKHINSITKTQTDTPFLGEFGRYSSQYPFNGRFDYMLAYNRSLTASEILYLYRNPFCMFESDDIVLLSAEEAALEINVYDSENQNLYVRV